MVAATLILISAFSFAQKQASCKFSYFAIDDSTTIQGINDNGVIVGLDSPKGFTRLPTGHTSVYLVPGSIFTVFNGINDSNIKVGAYTPSGTTVSTGLALHGKTVVSVHHPGDTWGTSLSGINKAGTVAGSFLNDNEISHGFTIKNGVITDLDFPNAFWTAPAAINDKGDVVGYYTFSDGQMHGFSDRGGSFSSFDFPGSLATSFTGISDGGVIVGQTRLPQNELWTPFLFKNNVFKIIKVPRAQFVDYVAMSPHGVVTGDAHYASGAKGFTATCQ